MMYTREIRAEWHDSRTVNRLSLSSTFDTCDIKYTDTREVSSHQETCNLTSGDIFDSLTDRNALSFSNCCVMHVLCAALIIRATSIATYTNKFLEIFILKDDGRQANGKGIGPVRHPEVQIGNETSRLLLQFIKETLPRLGQVFVSSKR